MQQANVPASHSFALVVKGDQQKGVDVSVPKLLYNKGKQPLRLRPPWCRI